MMDVVYAMVALVLLIVTVGLTAMFFVRFD